MSVSLSWNGLTFSRAVRLSGRGIQRDQRVFSAPGVDGVEVKRLGFRGLALAFGGQKSDTTEAAVDAWIVTVEALVRNGTATITGHGGAAGLENVQLDNFRVVARGRTEGGAYACVWVATFLQLRPNSA
jgi:hypothetical protein